MRSLIERFREVEVFVVGDFIKDVYCFGRVDRLSPEAPVPVFIEEREEVRCGGAGNVLQNLQYLGCTVAQQFGTPSSTKKRYIAGHYQLLRVDLDQVGSIYLPKRDHRLGHADVIVLSDYAKGAVTEDVCRTVIDSGKPVIVDPKGSDWRKYSGPNVIMVPNAHEYAAWDGNGSFGKIIIKRGAQGIELNGEIIPATAKQVFDVTGAGDTVVATIAAVIGAGGTHKDAAILANYAAGVVVGKIGTATCSKEELLCALDSTTVASTSFMPDIDAHSKQQLAVVTTSW